MRHKKVGTTFRCFKVQVWIYALDVAGPRFLVLKTCPARGSFWQPVTGGVEAGEAIPVAALREATEETGIAFIGAVEPLNHQFGFVRQGVPIEEHGFALKAPSARVEVRLDAREHDEFRWVTAREASELLRFDSNRDMLRILAGRLGVQEGV